MPAANDSTEANPEGTFRANVNGRAYTVADSGRIVSGPPACVNKWIAPSQLEVLKQTGDYHGHLLLSDTQEEVALAEAELELMRAEMKAPPEAVRESALFRVKGVEGRIEEVHDDGTCTVNLGGVVGRMRSSDLIVEAMFRHGSNYERDAVDLTEAQIAELDAAASEVSSDNDDPNGESEAVLESKTDEVLIAEAHARLEIVRKRKES